MSNNSQHIEEGRSAAMENYVDFNGNNKKEWLNSIQKESLSASDRDKYNTIVWVSNTSALLAGGLVGYYVRKKTDSFWKAFGVGLATTLVGYGIGYLATKSYSDKLGAKTGISSDSSVATQQKMNQLRDEALKKYYPNIQNPYLYGNYGMI